MPFPFPGDLPDPRIEPASPVLAGRFFTTEPPGKQKKKKKKKKFTFLKYRLSQLNLHCPLVVKYENIYTVELNE